MKNIDTLLIRASKLKIESTKIILDCPTLMEHKSGFLTLRELLQLRYDRRKEKGIE